MVESQSTVGFHIPKPVYEDNGNAAFTSKRSSLLRQNSASPPEKKVVESELVEDETPITSQNASYVPGKGEKGGKIGGGMEEVIQIVEMEADNGETGDGRESGEDEMNADLMHEINLQDYVTHEAIVPQEFCFNVSINKKYTSHNRPI